MQQQATVIPMTDVMLSTATTMSNDSFSRFADTSGHYNNTHHSHLIGRVGELAVEQYFLNKCPETDPIMMFEWQWSSIDSAFRDPRRDREHDIGFMGIRYEVKTWSDRYWDDLGRCVAEAQLAGVRRKADRIIWCSYGNDDAVVTLHGWNTPSELAKIPTKPTGPATGRKVINHQVPIRLMHRMELA